MLTLNGFFAILDKRAPIALSRKLVEQGDYDNSGIIMHSRDKVERVLFSLDLSAAAVKRAGTLKCDTVVTHHPAIYTPIKSLKKTDDTRALLAAAKRGLNVISMHLNLDVADGGIDASLMRALGGEKYRLIDTLSENNGYGREFETDVTLAQFEKNARAALKTRRTLTYGARNAKIKKVASFCGGGSGYALAYAEKGGSADLLVTSDMPHHIIKELTERGFKLLLITHYASENYGFERYYENVTADCRGKAETFFFADKAFL